MINSSQLKGKKVLTMDGRKVEDVDDILYDPEVHAIIGLLVSTGGMLSEPKIILNSDISEIGKDAVFIESKDHIRKTSELDTHIKQLAKDKKMRLTSGKIVDTKGTEYAKSSSVFFDKDTGEVIGFEYKEGMLPNSKKTMKIKTIISVGNDAIVVHPLYSKPGTEEQIDQQGSSETDNITQKTKQVGHIVKQNVNKLKSKAEEKMGMSGSQQNKQKSQQGQKQSRSSQKISPEKRKKIEDAVGKYLDKHILTQNDQVFAKQNQIITHEMLQEAYSIGLLDQILSSATNKPVIPG